MCSKGSPGATGEGRTSHGVPSRPTKCKCRPGFRKLKRPSPSTLLGSYQGHSCDVLGCELE